MEKIWGFYAAPNYSSALECILSSNMGREYIYFRLRPSLKCPDKITIPRQPHTSYKALMLSYGCNVYKNYLEYDFVS